MQMHPPDAAIRAATAGQSVPAPAQAVEPTILMGAQVCRLCLKGHSPPMHGRCCDPTAIATSALLTHWQSRSLTRRLQASKPVSDRLHWQQLARAGQRPAAE